MASPVETHVQDVTYASDGRNQQWSKQEDKVPVTPSPRFQHNYYTRASVHDSNHSGIYMQSVELRAFPEYCMVSLHIKQIFPHKVFKVGKLPKRTCMQDAIRHRVTGQHPPPVYPGTRETS